jgi:hypothetical protein
VNTSGYGYNAQYDESTLRHNNSHTEIIAAPKKKPPEKGVISIVDAHIHLKCRQVVPLGLAAAHHYCDMSGGGFRVRTGCFSCVGASLLLPWAPSTQQEVLGVEYIDVRRTIINLPQHTPRSLTSLTRQHTSFPRFSTTQLTMSFYPKAQLGSSLTYHRPTLP